MAYNVSNKYKQIIYSQTDENDIKVIFNGTELEDAGYYVEKVSCKSRILPEDASKRFSLDNFVSKELEIIFHNIDISSVEDQVEVQIGTKVDGLYEYVSLGLFNIQETPITNNNKLTLKLRDNRVKFDFTYNAKPLIDSLGGQATYKQILSDICTKAGVINDVTSFDNDNTQTSLYDNSIYATTYVSYLAEQSGMIATITRDGHLKFVDLSNLTTWRIPLSIVSDNYEIGEPFTIQRVCFEMGTIKFETSNDETLDTLYINSANPYIINQSQIDNIFTKLNGFTIDSVKFSQSILGNPAIDPYDIIEIYDDEDENEPVIFRTLANTEYTYNGKNRDLFVTEIGNEQRTENVTKTSDETYKKKITSEIDAVNGAITQTIEEVNQQNSRISQITQTVDEINSKISDIADITVSGGSEIATFTLDNINTSEPIQVKVKPITDNISYLYPFSGLYPSSSTYLKTRKVRFHNNTTNEDFDLVIPDDLLYYDSTHYDEFYLDYGDGTPETKICQVTKRCKYNADGTVGLLSEETTIDYEYPIIDLTDGDYTLSLIGYQYGYLFVRLIAKNIYTSQFYTKVETNSKIDQKANEITTTVSATYETKSNAQTNYTQIQQTTDNISSVVSTKVGSNEVISKINQSAEGIQINANKLSFTGKTIDLTGDNIAINSTKFNVDKNGNMTATNANITGEITATSGSFTGTITSSNGSIGSWSLNSDGIYNNNGFYINNYNLSYLGNNYNVGVSNVYVMADILICQLILSGVIPMPSSETPEFKHYDVNNDGVINSGDLLAIRHILNQS